MPPGVSERQIHDDAQTAAGELALVQYQRSQRAEAHWLQILADTLPWSEAVAAVLRDAALRASAAHEPPNAADQGGPVGGGSQAARPQHLKGGYNAWAPGRTTGQQDNDAEPAFLPATGGTAGRRQRRGGVDFDGDSRGDGARVPYPEAQTIQLALATLGSIPGHLAGAAEGRCSAAAFTLSVAMASTAEGGMPAALLRVVSPYRASLEQQRPLGRGGFGSVMAVRSRLDHRVMALKTVAFRSDLPPWAPQEDLERQQAKLLREVQALAGLDGSPHVVRYYSAWIEPAWEKLGQQLQRSAGSAERRGHARQAQDRRQANYHQALSAAVPNMKAPPAAMEGRRLRAANLASTAGLGAAPEPAAVPSPKKPQPLAHLPNHILPMLARIGSNDSGRGGVGGGGSGSQSCRIQELSDGSSASDGDDIDRHSVNEAGGAGSGERTGPGGRTQPLTPGQGRQHRLANATSTIQVAAAAAAAGSVLVSPSVHAAPDAAAPVTVTAAAAAEQDEEDTLIPQDPIVTLPPSSSEPTRRSFDPDDPTSESSHGFATGGPCGGVAIGDLTDDDTGPVAAVAVMPSPSPIVSLASTPDGGLSPLSHLWRLPSHPGWGKQRPPPLHMHSPQPLVISVSTSPEARTGATPTQGSILSSSVESIRVPPGARMAISPAYVPPNRSPTVMTPGSSDGGGYCSSGTATSRQGLHEGRLLGSAGHGRGDGGGHSGWMRQHQALHPEHYRWAYDGSTGAAQRSGTNTRNNTSRGSDESPSSSVRSSETMSSSSTTSTGSATRPTLGHTAVANANSEYSWTFDRGDEGGESVGATAAPGQGGFGSAAPGIGERGGGRGGTASERRSRKGRRGKDAARAAGGRGKRDSGGGSEGIFGPLEGATSTSGRPTRTSEGSRGDSSSDDDSRSGSGSGSGSGSDSNSYTSSSGSDDSGSGSWSGSGSDSETESESKGGMDRGRRRLSSRSSLGALIPPMQMPLLAPRHQRRRSAPPPIITSPVEESDANPLRRRGPRLRRRRHPPLPTLAEGASDCAHGPPPAAAGLGLDLAVLAGIRRWPYTLYISMELAPGPTLTAWLQRRAERLSSDSHGGAPPENPPEPATLERSIFRQIVAGLSYVHAAGIIHRDLKPANVFLVPVVAKPGAADAASWDALAGEPAAAVAAVGAAMAASAECYLVKIGDFGLAVEHADASITLEDAANVPGPRMPSSSSSSSGGAFSAAGTTTAGGHAAPYRRLSSLQLGANAAMTADRDSGFASGDLPRPRRSAAALFGGINPDGGLRRLESSSTSAHTSGVGTASYSAPEQLREQSDGVSHYGPEVDIYPLGLILMELFSIHTTAMERANAMREARQGRLPACFLRAYPGEAKLAEACLRTRPELRPSAEQLLAFLDVLWGAPLPGGAHNADGAMRSRDAAAAVASGGVAGGGVENGPAAAAAAHLRMAGAGGRGRAPEGQLHRQGLSRAFSGLAAVRGRAGDEGAYGLTTGVGAAGSGALQRATSGPAPPLNPPFIGPQRPLLPAAPPSVPQLQRFFWPSRRAPAAAASLSPDEAGVGSGSFRGPVVVARVLEDAGTQTDITWLSTDQPLLRPVGKVGKSATEIAAAAVAALAVQPQQQPSPPHTAVGEVAADGGPAVAPFAGGGGSDDERHRAALQARLQALEEEVQRLREQLGGGA